MLHALDLSWLVDVFPPLNAFPVSDVFQVPDWFFGQSLLFQVASGCSDAVLTLVCPHDGAGCGCVSVVVGGGGGV